MTGSDPELLRGALQGDERAFTALYRRRQSGVFRFALQMTGSVVLAEDLTQETFLALLTDGQRFDESRGSIASFLFGIVRNLVLRRLARQPRWEPEADGDLPADEDLLGDLTRREVVEQVRRAVLSLPPVYREVVVLCDLQDTPYEEAASALDCPVGTIRSRLFRGRALLAQKLEGAMATVGRSLK
jgi:RNA polymerase sigma-70 factor (ECF subfamily)